VGRQAATELRARGLGFVRPGETRALIQALRDENARLRALSMTMPQPRMAAARGGGVGGTVAAVRDDSSREVAAEAAEAAEAAREAAKPAFGGVLDGVAYPCSPDARSYCDGETEVEHETEAEAKTWARSGRGRD
jgi:hypothetical protein